MLFLSIVEFISRLHPLLVHLPIGILLIGLLLQWLSGKKRFIAVQPAVPIVLLWGTVAALASGITGYLLARNDDYDENLVGWHKWVGIGVVILAFLLYLKEKNPRFIIKKNILSVSLLTLIFATGHLGGSLTHGSDYITRPLKGIFTNDSSSDMIIQPIPNVQEALAYQEVIQPILQTKCYSCHGANKQKGGLRMDDSARLMKGGEDGRIINPHDAETSEMINRLLLPVDNEDHMPPKEKPQPSESQITLLHWWIASGADFNKKVKELPQPDKIKPILAALEKTTIAPKRTMDIPEEKVEPATETAIQTLMDRGIMVVPVARNSPYLSASFFTDSIVDKEDLQALLAIKKQLIWLKLGFTNIDDSGLSLVAELNNLTRLGLEHTGISDKGMPALKSLQKLKYLNLVGAQVTAKGVLELKELPVLTSIYLHQTLIDSPDWETLKNAFPKTTLDSGGYIVPVLPTDTTEVKAPPY